MPICRILSGWIGKVRALLRCSMVGSDPQHGLDRIPLGNQA
jgi:hypothetical protein